MKAVLMHQIVKAAEARGPWRSGDRPIQSTASAMLRPKPLALAVTNQTLT